MMCSRDSIQPTQAISIFVASGGLRHRESDHRRASRVCAREAECRCGVFKFCALRHTLRTHFWLCHAERLRFIVTRPPALRYQRMLWAGAPEWLVADFCRHKAAVRGALQRPVSAQSTEEQSDTVHAVRAPVGAALLSASPGVCIRSNTIR